MGPDNIDVREQRPGAITAPNRASNAGAPTQRAMSQQGSGAHSHACIPQQLVRLVGYRDPHGGAARDWDRLRARQDQYALVK